MASSAAVPSEDGMLLVPDYALGYNGRDVRSNLGYNAEGSLVYYIARLGVVYDKATATQVRTLARRSSHLRFVITRALIHFFT